MLSIYQILLATAFISTSLAHPPSSPKTCTDYTIPVNPTSVNYVWAKPFKNNFDVVDFISDLASRTAATDYHPFSGGAPVTASYKISATFCTPSKGGYSSGNVLLASHGLNFDRSYWDPEIQPDKYSFVDYAISKGYSILFYDRLGVGKSSSVSGYVAQASVQTVILTEIASLVKAGKYTGNLGKPKKLILIGHSFGSVISAAAVTAQPKLADGIVLTGFSFNGTNGPGFISTFQPRIASADPKFSHLDNGYLSPVDLFSNIDVFFKAPDYDLKVALYADAHKQPFAVNEAISGGVIDVVAKDFEGPAMVIAGQYDLIFCTGQCDAVIEHPAKEIFAKAKAFKAVSWKGAGHGLNFAKSAKGAFVEILEFLGANGL